MYIAEKGQMILGWPHQAELGIRIDPKANPSVYAVQLNCDNFNKYEGLKEEFPGVFTAELGKLKDFKHEIIVKDNAIPVRQKICNVPVGYRGKLKVILDDLCAKDIIEPIEIYLSIAFL